jgi:2-methylcitrate dehydratase PrpD
MLARGHVEVDDFDDASIRDPAILALAAKTTGHADPAVDYPRFFPGRLRITFAGGRVEERAEPINRGSAERPLTDDQVRDKLRRNAARALPPGQVDRLIEAVERIEDEDPLRNLGAACVPGRDQSARRAVP